MKIPQFDLPNFELAFAFNNGIMEIGIPEYYLAQGINLILYKYEGRTRDTNSEKIDITDLKFFCKEGGFAVEGKVQVQFRKLLGEAPVIGAMYSPWVTIAGSFVEELTVDVIEGRLNVSHSQLHLSTTDSWYRKLFDEFVLPYLEEEIVKRINEQLSNFNGMSLEEIVLKQGKTKLSQKLGRSILNESRVNTLLKLANTGVNRFDRLQGIKNKLDLGRINARVSQEYLWLSIVQFQVKS